MANGIQLNIAKSTNWIFWTPDCRCGFADFNEHKEKTLCPYSEQMDNLQQYQCAGFFFSLSIVLRWLRTFWSRQWKACASLCLLTKGSVNMFMKMWLEAGTSYVTKQDKFLAAHWTAGGHEHWFCSNNIKESALVKYLSWFFFFFNTVTSKLAYLI